MQEGFENNQGYDNVTTEIESYNQENKIVQKGFENDNATKEAKGCMFNLLANRH